MAEENPASALAAAIPDVTVPASAPAPMASLPDNTAAALPPLMATESADPPGKKPRRPPPRSPATAIASKELKAVLPTNERLHVYKRGEEGNVGFCADYSTNEVKGFGTIEAFLKKYSVPKFGYGEYHLHLQKGSGPLAEVGRVNIVAPLVATTPNEVSNLKDLLEAQRQMDKDAKNEGATVFDGMAKMMSVLKDLQSSDGKGNDMASMMMLMQMMQPAQAPKTDLVTEALLRRLESIEKKMSQPPLPAPMPMPAAPPPPAPDPLASLGPMMTGMMDTMGRLIESQNRQPPPPQRDVLGEMVQMKSLFASREEGFGAKEIIGLLPTLKDLIAPPPAGGPVTLEGQLIELKQARAMVRDLENEFRPQQESNSFWENVVPLLGQLLGRRDMAQEVAAGVNQAGQQPPHQLPPPQEEEEEEESKLQIPPGFAPFAEKINDSKTDLGQKIGAFIMGMQFLVKYENFRPAIMAIFDRLKVNDRHKSLSLIDGFLSAFVQEGIIEEEAAQDLFHGMQVHFDVIRQKMGFEPASKPTSKPTPHAPVSGAQGAPGPDVPPGPAPPPVDATTGPGDAPADPAPVNGGAAAGGDLQQVYDEHKAENEAEDEEVELSDQEYADAINKDEPAAVEA